MVIDLAVRAPLPWVERPGPDAPDDLVRALAALANPVRLRILRFLIDTEGCFCGDLVAEIGLAQSTVSHHLKTLREAGLVLACEQGTFVSYCVDRDRLATVRVALDHALAAPSPLPLGEG
jgi:DNA-binding transcriptional ArsR family regulator